MSPLTDALWPAAADVVSLAAVVSGRGLATLAVWAGVVILAAILFDGGDLQ